MMKLLDVLLQTGMWLMPFVVLFMGAIAYHIIKKDNMLKEKKEMLAKLLIIFLLMPLIPAYKLQGQLTEKEKSDLYCIETNVLKSSSPEEIADFFSKKKEFNNSFGGIERYEYFVLKEDHFRKNFKCEEDNN